MADSLPRRELQTPFDAHAWKGERLKYFECGLGKLPSFLPVVFRRPFRVPAIAVAEMTDEELAHRIHAEACAEEWGHPACAGTPSVAALHPRLDAIVRLPGCGIPEEVPLGIVSRRYRLVQHAELVERLGEGLAAANVPWKSLHTIVRLTELGSRVHFTVVLPPEYRIRIGTVELDLTIECLNSIDRSWALRAGMGWIRGICGNGLFFGQVTASVHWTHGPGMRIEKVPGIVLDGFKETEREAVLWKHRSQFKVSTGQLRTWIDDTVAKKWGDLVALRVLHIVQTGRDAIPLDSNDRKRPPSRRRVTSGSAVPGSEPPNEDLFRIAQVLAWMANRATEWGTAVERRRQIPQLLRPLAASLPGGTMLFH